jgi:abequosyltransferase
MNAVRLSVAIPTYNFGRFIGETLDSILPQVPAGAEVLVVDGASTDETEEVVRTRTARFPALRYHRLDRKGGIDRDMAAAVELARGEYCWLFSADDIMLPGALADILGRLDEGADVYLLRYRQCSFDLSPKYLYPFFESEEEARHDLHDASQRAAYFRSSLATTALFSFMGSLVVRKETWARARFDESFYGSCWAHAARLLAAAKERPLVVRYLPGPYLDKRDDNDSFSEGGVARRVAITVDGYNRIADRTFGRSSEEARQVRRLLKNEYPLANLLFLKLRVWREGGRDDRCLMRRLVGTLHSDGTFTDLLKILVWNLAPAALLSAADRIRRSLRGRAPAPPPAA